MCSANDVLLLPILMIIYCFIFGFLFNYNCQDNQTSPIPSRVEKLHPFRTKPENSQRSITISDRIISRQSKQETNSQEKRRKYSPGLYLRVIEHLDRLSYWRIYSLCMRLAISLDIQGKQKPIDLLKAEIRSCFRNSPAKVMAAFRVI